MFSNLQKSLQLYQIRLDISPSEYDQLWSLLSTDERSRADCFKKDNLRRNFIAARGNLRLILARSLSCEPTEIQFAYSDRGKPYLLDDSNNLNKQKIYFNLAHSQDLAIYAVSQDREVGVDLEFINSQINFLGIAKRYFLASELQMIRELSDRNLACQLFYQIWTLKEAYAKATGKGIANLLNQIDVTPLLNSYLNSSQQSPKEFLQIGDWQLQLINSQFFPFEMDSNYMAALCVAIKA